MKSIFGLFLFLLFPFSFAQTSLEFKDPKVSTFNFNFINGYAISYHYLTTENFWLRAQLDLFLNGDDMEGESDQYYTSNAGVIYANRTERDENNNDSYLEVAISTQIMFPLYKSKYGIFYLGAGPRFAYATQSRTYDSESRNYSPDTVSVPYTTKSSSEIDLTDYDLGLIGVLGISAFITDNISLYAETHFSGGLRWTDSNTIYKSSSVQANYEDKNETDTSSNGWFYEARFIRLGVSISI